ncbi:MAG: serine/threonine-protein phosphatase [Deltaproteobacteria bacterium]|nr:serine/threonine-protein phosphatase [Deltaproteobacteria bacterium]
MKLCYGHNSHPGRRRTSNEDKLLVVPEENLFAVADGMGGHAAGELASTLCVDALREWYDLTRGLEPSAWPLPPAAVDDPLSHRLVIGIRRGHERILETMKKHPQLRGMGTTVVASWFVADRVLIAHVGDSRCYRLRGGRIEQLTRDHSLVNALRDRFELNQEQEARARDMSHILVRALGVEDDAYADVDLLVLAPEPHDTFLLCSDGLTDEVRDLELLSILGQEDAPGRAAARLIRRANERGGRDNISAIVVEYCGVSEGEGPYLDEETVDMTNDWFQEPDDAAGA